MVYCEMGEGGGVAEAGVDPDDKDLQILDL